MPKTEGGVKTSLADKAAQIAKGGERNGMFGPGDPLPPEPPHPPRVFDYAPGWNRVSTPRSYEPYSFSSLRAFANVEMVRLAIETRKDQLCRLAHVIKPRNQKKGEVVTDAGAEEIARLFAKPDGKRPFSSWFRVLLEDLLAIDAP
ncbi:MAG: phage portal protein, partial [Solimonas sp.]